jgi:mannose-6-phosphate isomerase-like protein (cupin superfamily)
MIVTDSRRTCETRGPRGTVKWRCLARRGMLHSECESFDYLLLDPGSEIDLPGPGKTESAWFILAGSGRLRLRGAGQSGDPSHLVEADQLVLLPAGAGAQLASGPDGLALLLLSVWPGEVTRSLPVRRPVT